MQPEPPRNDSAMSNPSPESKLTVSSPNIDNGHHWRYAQPETGAVFTGFSYGLMRELVIKHRKAMGFPFDDADFQDELCRQNTAIDCSGRVIPPGERHMTIADVRRFMSSLSSWDGSFVDQEEAERRATICAGCPMNVVVHGCKGCGGILKWVNEKLGGNATSKDRALESCAVCGCYNAVSVWIPLEAQNTDGLTFAEGCWKVAAGG